MRLLLGISAFGLALLVVLVRPDVSVLVPRSPDAMSYAVHAGAACVFLTIYTLYAYDRHRRPQEYEHKRSASGFVIVGAMLGIAAGVAAPMGLRSLAAAGMTSNEASAADALRLVALGEKRFREEDLDSDGVRDYAASLRKLAACKGWACPEGLRRALSAARPVSWKGYVFTPVTAGWGGPLDRGRAFAVQASPAAYGRTGIHTFYVTEEMRVRRKDCEGLPLLVVPDSPEDDGWEVVGGH